MVGGGEGREEDGAAWPESQGHGGTRVASLSTWARAPAGTGQCGGDTLGRARETGLGGGPCQGLGDGQTPTGQFSQGQIQTNLWLKQ